MEAVGTLEGFSLLEGLSSCSVLLAFRESAQKTTIKTTMKLMADLTLSAFCGPHTLQDALHK